MLLEDRSLMIVKWQCLFYRQSLKRTIKMRFYQTQTKRSLTLNQLDIDTISGLIQILLILERQLKDLFKNCREVPKLAFRQLENTIMERVMAH